MTAEHHDVVIVGAGIAGSALATGLARGGVDVLLLERTEQFVDHVRGEYLHPWGHAEAQRLGVDDTLIAAGGNVITRFVGYDEVYSTEEAESAALPLAGLIPEVPGGLGIGHPVACQALFDAAVGTGATAVRGVEGVRVVPGPEPKVEFEAAGEHVAVDCRVVVAADGRESGIRRQLEVELNRSDSRIFLAGMLVDGVRDWQPADAMIGTEGDAIRFVFPQLDGRVRLYMGYSIEDRRRFAGADRSRAFLESFRVGSIPDSGRLADARPAGPCAAYPMFDSWTDDVVRDGVVFAGDAAGFSDPTIGEGLSVALRDARQLRDAMIGSDDWSPAAFGPYVEERAERMRRLRFAAQVFTDAHIPLGPDGTAERRRRSDLMVQDPELFMVIAAMTCGPELASAEYFTEPVRERLLGTARSDLAG